MSSDPSARSKAEAARHVADIERRVRIGAEMAASYRACPQTAGEDAAAMANAIALTEAEPW